MNLKPFLFTASPALLAVLTMLASPPPGQAQEPADFFRNNCASCHTIGGGRLTGPDLKNVTQRKERDWLVRFLQSPKAVIDGGDPYALKILEEARGVVMPPISGMNPGLAEQLLTMIEAESKLDKSQFSGAQISDRPFTEQDVAIGRAIFTGDRRLANGGPPCIGCHTLNDLRAFGGGRLGPDLSKSWERLQGRKNMGAWLSAPATPTMKATFKNTAFQENEILPLLALFDKAARNGGEDDRSGLVGFFVVSFAATIALLAVLGSIWKNRFRAVRRPLVESSAQKVLGGRS